MASSKKKKTPPTLYKKHGGGNTELTRSMRDHPTYKKPELRLVQQ
jgi:hypothetical protein